MFRQNGQSRSSLVRRLAITVCAFLFGHFISTSVLPGGVTPTLRLIVFLAVYAGAYIALWRITEELRHRQVDGPRR